MRRSIASFALALALLPLPAPAAQLGSLIANQPSAPVKILSCRTGYSEINGATYAQFSFKAGDAPVRAVTVRLALLGMDQRPLDESAHTVRGTYSPGVEIVLPDRFKVSGRSYPNGTGLCAVSAVEMADGRMWYAQGSDHPWQPFDSVLWGDEVR